MELFSPAFWLALLNVVFIDLILAGDNAIVIGLAARNLHPSVQKKLFCTALAARFSFESWLPSLYYGCSKYLGCCS